MKLEVLRKYLNQKPGSYEDFPFGPDAMVLKVKKKMYGLIAIKQTPLHISLKCDPDLALSLRHAFDAVRPAYHMNKRHWNTIILNGEISKKEIFAMIDDSYNLVVKSLKKADREELAEKV